VIKALQDEVADLRSTVNFLNVHVNALEMENEDLKRIATTDFYAHFPQHCIKEH